MGIGLIGGLGGLAGPRKDEEGARLARMRESSRVRHRQKVSNDL
jgi:hypothetical protein